MPGGEAVFSVLYLVEILDQQIAAVRPLADQSGNVIAVFWIKHPALGKTQLVAAFFTVAAGTFSQFLVERVHGTSRWLPATKPGRQA